MAFVYWFHFKDHEDIKTQGYVGITSGSYRRRWREHKSSLIRGIHSNPYFQNIVNKYGFDSLEFTVICECTEKYAKELEEKLRPEPRIGWNIMKGGEVNWDHAPMSEERKKFQSEMVKNLWKDPEYMQNQREKSTGRYFSEESRQKKSASLKKFYQNGSHLPVFKRGRANEPQCRELWVKADEIFKMYADKISDREISRTLGFDKRNSTIMKQCRLFDEGWNPSLDPEWVAFKEENYNV